MTSGRDHGSVVKSASAAKMGRDLEGKTIVFFHDELVESGGSERIALEEARFFEQRGAKTYFLTYRFHDYALYNGKYCPKVQLIGKPVLFHNSLLKGLIYFPSQILALRRKLKELRPNVIISRTAFGCVYLYFATFFTSFPYVAKLYETPLWAYGDQRQHALIYRRTFAKIREWTPTHRRFITLTPKTNPMKRLMVELGALAEYCGVRKARKIFCCSGIMKQEIKEIYDREAVVTRCSVPEEIFTYKAKQDIKKKLGICDKIMIFSVCHLAPRKRIDLLIRAFHQLHDGFGNVILVIGGRGPEKEKLDNLARQLGIEAKVKLVGFINEDELWDYYAACDVYAHPDWADADLTPITALALKKKVVWTTDMEIDPALRGSGYIFVAQPTPADFARAIEQALITEETKAIDLSNYTWQRYYETMLQELRPFWH